MPSTPAKPPTRRQRPAELRLITSFGFLDAAISLRAVMDLQQIADSISRDRRRGSGHGRPRPMLQAQLGTQKVELIVFAVGRRYVARVRGLPPRAAALMRWPRVG